MEEYFEIGQIVNTSGLKGILKIKPFTDDIKKFSNLKTIYIKTKSGLTEFKIEQVRYVKNMVMLKLAGIDTVEEAEKYRNLYIKILRDQEEELEEGSYYVVDILGCKVNTDANQELGKIVDVFQTGSNDVYVVKDEQGKQILLPAIKQVIKNVDIKNKIITVHLLEGLV
ncbi:MAG: ribosome maturation factor RimM [Clostridia bacterium]|jgi:16S rRNA processing protein rimM|nr:ribosome maturation factor RimM [Clostridium sp. CAG:452]DAL05852.1 MAG TPA: 16S rRNA-processing protein [Caudoviricetes sp.]